jgi:phosphopantothenoylcysteine decarboxylase/phosphopantothenate--cysteine ligase
VTNGEIAQNLVGKRILLIVGGGVAAYKSLELLRRLRERGARTRVVMTDSAKEFVTEMSFAAISGAPVHNNLFDAAIEGEMGHIQLSRDADLVVVAPATANLLARAAQGLADDLATTLLLATDKRILFAPAMNWRMWLHPATQRNAARLRADGALFVGPEEGDMACGEYGPGRMSEPLDIVAAIVSALAQDTRLAPPQNENAGSLIGRHVVVTSGPTYEPIDPVRFIANRSSGKQGHAIAAAAAGAGAKVTLISGPVTLPDPAGVETRHVQTAREMLAAVEAAMPADIFVAVAAVADWRAEAAAQKIKKQGSAPALKLVENPDILLSIAARKDKRPAVVVGFAAETSDVLRHSQEKFARKGCDMLVANDVSAGVFGTEENEVCIITAASVENWPRLGKEAVAARLIGRLAKMLADRSKEIAS